MLGQTVLGKYKVIRLLDEGGMSKVYLGRHRETGHIGVTIPKAGSP